MGRRCRSKSRVREFCRGESQLRGGGQAPARVQGGPYAGTHIVPIRRAIGAFVMVQLAAVACDRERDVVVAGTVLHHHCDFAGEVDPTGLAACEAGRLDLVAVRHVLCLGDGEGDEEDPQQHLGGGSLI